MNKNITQTFNLNDVNNLNTLPLLPHIHDFLIEEVLLDSKKIIFKLQQNLKEKTYLEEPYSNTKSLIIKYHLQFDALDCTKCLSGKKKYKKIKIEKILSLMKTLRYITQYVGLSTIIISLGNEFKDVYLQIEAVNEIEYEWIES